MPSLARTIKHFRAVGFKQWYRQMWGIGDAKSGTLVGTDQFGNKFYENTIDEVPGRHRWVDYTQHDFNATQVPPEWHAWLTHIRKDAPQDDPIVQQSTPPWKAAWTENLTGTRGKFVTYSTTAPKVRSWEPKVAHRGAGASEAKV